MTRALAAILFFVLNLAAPFASAGKVVHNAVEGETLEVIAKRYYGNEDLAASLRIHNSLGDARLTPGSVIEVPLATEHTVSAGEDWSTLAARYWGDWQLGEVMPLLVQPAEPTLEPGTRVGIPALIHHRVGSGENLARLSRRSYGNPFRAQAIGVLNGLENPDRLKVGQHLRLPVLGGLAEAPAPAVVTPVVAAPAAPVAPVDPVVPVVPAVAAAAPTAGLPPVGVAHVPEVVPEYKTQELMDAIETFYEGEFETARRDLESLRPELLASGSPAQQRVLLEHLIRVHAAFDDTDLTCARWAELAALDPEQPPSPERFSPKVQQISSGCR